MKRIVIVLFFVLMVGILLAACTAEETEQVLPTETPLPSLPTPTESTVLDDLTAIEMALAEYMGVGDVQVGEAEITALYATGGVENGYFLAARSGDDWVIVYAGQAVPPCGEIEQYDFPVEMVPECLYDGKVVLDRTSDQPPENEPLDDPERAILEALAAYLGQDVDNMDAAVTEIEGTIAKGTIENGYFLAAESEDGWVYIHGGQTSPPCSAIDPYPFPLDWVPECVGDDGEIVDRSDSVGAEPTESPLSEEDLILEALAAHMNMDVDGLQASVTEIDGNTAIGSIENGYYLAAKSGGTWIIVHDGQTNPECGDVDPYGFSENMVPECFDANGSLVQRSEPAEEPMSAALGPPSWRDEMDSSARWYLVDTENTTFSMGEGVLVMKVDQAGGYEEWGMATVPLLDDIYLEVEFETGSACAGKDKYGVIFRAPDPNKGYVYEFSCDGMYRIYRWDGSSFYALRDWTPSPNINSGPGVRNVMGVLAVGSEIDLYANSQHLDEVADDMFESGRIGLVIGSENTNNFVVYVDSVTYWFIVE